MVPRFPVISHLLWSDVPSPPPSPLAFRPPPPSRVPAGGGGRRSHSAAPFAARRPPPPPPPPLPRPAHAPSSVRGGVGCVGGRRSPPVASVARPRPCGGCARWHLSPRAPPLSSPPPPLPALRPAPLSSASGGLCRPPARSPRSLCRGGVGCGRRRGASACRRPPPRCGFGRPPPRAVRAMGFRGVPRTRVYGIRNTETQRNLATQSVFDILGGGGIEPPPPRRAQKNDGAQSSRTAVVARVVCRLGGSLAGSGVPLWL